MKHVKYPESIFCQQCEENVEMVDCRVASVKAKGKTRVEFDYVCVDCGHRASVIREWELLQFSEREFCRKNGLAELESQVKGKGVIYDRTILNKN
jgi:hypothetical protein